VVIAPLISSVIGRDFVMLSSMAYPLMVVVARFVGRRRNVVSANRHVVESVFAGVVGRCAVPSTRLRVYCLD